MMEVLGATIWWGFGLGIGFTTGRWLMLVLGEGLEIFLNGAWIGMTKGKKGESK